MKLPQDGDNELWTEGSDWINRKVIAKVWKVMYGSFSHHGAVLMVLIDLKVIVKVRKVQFEPLVFI